MNGNNRRDSMALGLPKGASEDTPLVTGSTVYTRFWLYDSEFEYLGSTKAFSAQHASEKWERLYGETPHLVSEAPLEPDDPGYWKD